MHFPIRLMVGQSSNFGHLNRVLCCGLPLIRGGRQIALRRMQTDVVVEPDDVIGDVATGFGMVGVVVLPDPLHLTAAAGLYCRRNSPIPFKKLPLRRLTDNAAVNRYAGVSAPL